MYESEHTDMPITTTSVTAILLKNSVYLLWIGFYLAVDWMISIFPDWKNFLENFKLIGGALIIVLLITKLLLEISKLKKENKKQ